MSSYKIIFDKALGWVIEIIQSDLKDRQAIVLEDHEEVRDFLQEFGFAYQNSLEFEPWSSFPS